MPRYPGSRHNALSPYDILRLEEEWRNHGPFRVGPFELRPFSATVTRLELEPWSSFDHRLSLHLRVRDRASGEPIPLLSRTFIPMSKRCAGVALEACTKWPVGDDYPLFYTGDEDNPNGVRVFERLDRKTIPARMWPAAFDPVGTLEGGPVKVDDGEVVVEEMGGYKFARALLDTVRAAYTGVRWCVHLLPHGSADGVTMACAYACLDGRVVGIVASRRIG